MPGVKPPVCGDLLQQLSRLRRLPHCHRRTQALEPDGLGSNPAHLSFPIYRMGITTLPSSGRWGPPRAHLD